MSSLFLACDKGAAGDMITAALLELFEKPEEMVQKLNAMHVPGVEYMPGSVRKYGIQGNTMTVLVHGEDEEDVLGDYHEHCHGHDHEHTQEHCQEDTHKHVHEQNHKDAHTHAHAHMSMQDIRHIVDHIQVTEKVREDILQVYGIIADAEAKAHGCPVSEVHFHEVGAMDAIADVTAVCFLIDALQPEKIVASEIRVGNGTVKCAHGVLPVPAPATANIIQGLPWAHGRIDGEICTPTGAALVRYFAEAFAAEPVTSVKRKGIGLGKRTFSSPSYFAAWTFEA